ncbi:Sortase (surface protein transpeptidase) [Mycobacteroides abscessus subsp. abscessus]|nr:Sortase (surface protein transpeptidase) [Mycobacteroides abscessus subsp. abscessus]
MKIKIFSILIIIFGISLTGYAVYEIAFTEVKAKESVEKAKQVVQGNPEEVSQSNTISEPEQGSIVGLLTLPKIEAELAIVEGTDPDDLEKGVGHYKGSYFPNENGQIVLSGHRDTVFKRVGELEIGDEMTVETSKGSFSYKIESTKVVEADDTSIITLQNQEEELILTTCYPFGFIGNAPQRYIIYAKRVL